MNKKVAIITDSTCDLSKEMLKDLNITVIGLYVNFTNKSFIDGDNITTEKLYELVEQEKELPKTAAPSPAEFYKIFEKCITNGYDVFYTGIGASFSRSYDNALIAKEQLEADNIYIMDSQNLSTGIGLQLLKACKFRTLGYSAKEIYDNLSANRGLVRAQFAIETMEYLHKGGRCSGLVKLIGTFLKIKPIIKVREGKMVVGQKPRGKMQVALDTLLDQISADKDNVDLDNIIVTHSIAQKSAAYVIPKLKEMFPQANILETQAGCVISSHCGQGTIGILYILTKETIND